ncbi:MAG: hypothetical protein ABEI11_03895 [Haloarculaceae archaeon]
MTQHAVRTALTLYQSGTYTLETAARHAGRSPETLRRELLSLGVDVGELAAEPARERARIAAD